MMARARAKTKEPPAFPGREPVLGQDAALDTLKSAITSGRLASSWIFHGPEGVGKRTTAARLARLLLEPQCSQQEIETFSPPAHSATQDLVNAGTHPDLVVITKEMSAVSQIARLRDKKQMDIPVDLLREYMIGGLIKQENKVFEPAVYHTPAMGPRRIFIIDEADLLNHTGQNALLKTLEEPPSTSVIILLTTNPDRLLPTIRSRCQRLAFRRLDEASMSRWLTQAQLSNSDEDMSWAISFSDGSPGRLLFALEHGLADWHEIIESGVNSLMEGRFPAEFSQDLSKLIDDFAKAKEKVNRKISKEAAKREGLDAVLSMIAAGIRSKMHEAIDCGDHARAETTARSIDHLVEAERRIGRSLSQKLVLADMTAALGETLAGSD